MEAEIIGDILMVCGTVAASFFIYYFAKAILEYPHNED